LGLLAESWPPISAACFPLADAVPPSRPREESTTAVAALNLRVSN
jgi:hypothetical protein